MIKFQNTTQTVKVYFRNYLKYAIIQDLPSVITHIDLYCKAAKIYNFPQQPQHQFHLYIAGKLIKNEEKFSITLQPKQIIHIVNLQNLDKQIIFLTVRKLEGRLNAIKFEVYTDTKIKDFIDDKLFKVYGQTSSDIFLVNVGRKLDKDKTFKQQLIQNQSQLICLNFKNKSNRQKQSLQHQIPILSQNLLKAMIKTSYNQNDNLADKIYPMPNFIINTPKTVEDSNKLNFLYDSKIMHSSSINKSQIDPQSVIEEQNSIFLSEKIKDGFDIDKNENVQDLNGSLQQDFFKFENIQERSERQNQVALESKLSKQQNKQDV